PEPLFTLPQCLLRLFTLGDVSRYFGGADNFPSRIPHRGNRQRYLNRAAVLAHSNGVKMLNALASSHPIENSGLFVPTIGRDDKRDRLTHSLQCRVTEEPLRAPIPADDGAIQIFANNAILRRV